MVRRLLCNSGCVHTHRQPIPQNGERGSRPLSTQPDPQRPGTGVNGRDRTRYASRCRGYV